MVKFLIVGKSFSGLEEAIKQRGDDFVVLHDVDDQPAIEKLRGQVDAVKCIYENFVLAAAKICQQLSLPGLTIESAKKCTDKTLMRAAFAASPEAISPAFAEIKDEAGLKTFAEQHEFPLIIKPANLTKSLHVTKNHDLDELLANYRKTIDVVHHTYAKYAPAAQPKLLVEEFLEGSVHSVDGFADAKGKPFILKEIVDYETGYDIGYEDNFHYSRRLPSQLPPAEQKALLHVAGLGMKALGMTSSPAHIEIIFTKHGPRIVEIGARNGGYRDRMHRLANGLDIMNISLEVALGHQPDVTAKYHEDCAVLELFPKEPGIFSGIRNEDKLKQLKSLVYYAVKQPYGKPVGKSADGYKMCAIVILHHKNSEQFEKDLAFVNESVAVETTPAA